ncbi:MAG: membrane protein [Silanimonas sp.]|nr:MAG: membrane protein [Silanimonas sp.]
MRNLRTWFLTGLLTLLPLWLAWLVVSFLFGLLVDLSRPWVGPLLVGLSRLSPELFGWLLNPWVLPVVALVGTLVVIIGVGALTRRVVGQTLLGVVEGLIARVPLVNVVYSSARKLLDLLQHPPGGKGQRVVLIDFPNREMKAVGFVTRLLREEGSGRELAAVYVPTTPNPTSGYLEIVPVDRLTPTDWSFDEAMAFIISGGAVAPEAIPFDRPRE